MLYKPNYCCNCGEKIERIEWNLLTSRRFCEVCALDLKKFDLVPRVTVALGVLAAVFGLGSMWSSTAATGPPPAPQTLTSHKNATNVSKERETVKPNSVDATATKTSVEPRPDNTQPEPDPPARSQATYFCGARTKKGTPCSRKVKTAGSRCYQHEGKPSAESGE